MKRTVSDLMRQKDLTPVPSISRSASIREALDMLCEADVGALLVVGDDSELAGIFSERDFVKAFLSETWRDHSQPVSSLMNRNVAYVTPEYRLEQCLAVMSELKVRHLPVLCGTRPLALLSMSHIAEAIIQDREFMIDELVKYVTGSASLAAKVGSEESSRKIWQGL